MLVTKDGQLIAHTIADSANGPEFFVTSLLKKAKQDGYLVVGKKALLYESLVNIAWE
jgi:hypothetical protein